MATIFHGERWDSVAHANKVHAGTSAYLRMIGASQKDGPGYIVPDDHVDLNGKYIPVKAVMTNA